MTDFEQVKADYQKFSENLLEVPFTTLDEYFEALKDYGQRMDKLVNKVRIIILAAAVSDFTCEAETEKIDSSREMNQIRLFPVKKVISTLTTEWAPSVNTISFKLETDESLIIKKSKKYFDQGVKVVIGNELTTRRHQVFFITRDNSEAIRVTGDTEIEEPLADRICAHFNGTL